MCNAIKLHQWLRALEDLKDEDLISDTVYNDSVDSVWNIARIIGETENLKSLTGKE